MEQSKSYCIWGNALWCLLSHSLTTIYLASMWEWINSPASFCARPSFLKSKDQSPSSDSFHRCSINGIRIILWNWCTCLVEGKRRHWSHSTSAPALPLLGLSKLGPVTACKESRKTVQCTRLEQLECSGKPVSKFGSVLLLFSPCCFVSVLVTESSTSGRIPCRESSLVPELRFVLCTVQLVSACCVPVLVAALTSLFFKILLIKPVSQ